MEKLTTSDIANFVWLWGKEFFLETEKGNYIWSDPDYGGDNTICPYKGSFKEYLKKIGVYYGRGKGKHYIVNYCGEDVKILDK